MKISFFLGRIHHAMKLLPIAAALQERTVEIEFIVANNSINIDPATAYLHQFGINEFHHVNDYIDNIGKVNTIVDTLKIDLRLFKYIPPFWIMSSIREAAECSVGFNNYLDVSKPDAVFGLHENNFWVKMLFYLAHQREIRTYSLQEGIILEREERDLKKYSLGTDYTDFLFSWSEYDKQFYSDESKIHPVGPSHLDEFINIKNDSDKMREFVSLAKSRLGISLKSAVITFAPPRLDLYKGNFIKALEALALWTRDRGNTLLVSFHPFQGGLSEIEKTLSIYPHVVMRHDTNGLDYIMISDSWITQTSTTALEALILGIPVIELDMDYIGLEQPLWKLGATTLVEGDDLSKLSKTEIIAGNTFIEDRFPLADGKSTQRIVDFITGELWSR